MIPMAVNGVPATLRHPSEVSDGYGVVREWADVCDVFVTLNPSSSTQTATEEGLAPAEEFGVFFVLPRGRSVHPDDRLVMRDVTLRLMSVSDFRGSVNGRAVRIYDRRDPRRNRSKARRGCRQG